VEYTNPPKRENPLNFSLNNSSAIKKQKFPETPGCYIFKSKHKKILYVGKSKCLKKRILSYFSKQKKLPKIKRMIRLAQSVECICTATDIEALLLEYTLIKKFRPQYNAKMVKDYPKSYIAITATQNLLGFFVVNEIEKSQTENILYAAPFFRKRTAEENLELLGKYFNIPTCGFGKNFPKKPCSRFFVKKCLAPCILHNSENKENSEKSEKSEKNYISAAAEVLAFLSGNFQPTLDKLYQQMQQSAQQLKYERAAYLRDKIEILTNLSKQISRVPPNLENKNFYVALKSHHDSNTTLCVYVQNKCVQNWTCITCENNKVKSTFASFNRENGLLLAKAILEIDAKRSFLEIE